MRNIVNKVHETTIRFNSRFADGYAKQEIANSVDYVSKIFRCANKAFPEGLRFEYAEVCSARKAHNVVMERIKKNDKKFSFDFAMTNIYLTQFNLSFKGTPLAPIYMYMPYTNDAAMMDIRDKAFYIKPVAADPLISVTPDSIYLPLNQTKMTTRSRPHYVYKDELLTHIKIIDTTIHHSLSDVHRKDTKEARARITTNAHYLFCEFGFRETFRDFGAVVEVGYKDTINTTKYPKEDWVIYRSTEDKNAVQLLDSIYVADDRSKSYIPNKVCLAVKRKDVNRSVESLVGAFFYVLDLIPLIDGEDDISYLDDAAWWTVRIGKIILGVDNDHRIIMKKMLMHFRTMASYIDPMAVDLMRDNNIFVEDMHAYLAWLINNFDDKCNNPDFSPSTMYGKYLLVNRFIFSKVREAIFKGVYELRQKSPEKLNPRIIHTVLSSKLRPNLITRINNNFPNVSAVISASDSRLLKMGTEIVPQDNVRSGKPEKQPEMLQNPKWQLDPSYFDAGVGGAMSKHEPIGKDGGNPCIEVSFDGEIKPQPKLKKQIAEFRAAIKQHEF